MIRKSITPIAMQGAYCCHIFIRFNFLLQTSNFFASSTSPPEVRDRSSRARDKGGICDGRGIVSGMMEK
jgi:hypothetical protein